MVLAYYGHAHSEDELRQLLRTGARGTPARNVILIASLGFEVEVRFPILSLARKSDNKVGSDMATFSALKTSRT
jgi:hypothetical protein